MVFLTLRLRYFADMTPCSLVIDANYSDESAASIFRVSSTLTGYSETLIPIYQTTRHFILEERYLRSQLRLDIKFRIR
jgi:hypothetical protein